MRLNGVDIAGYQQGIDTRGLTADFVIVKATEGTQGTVYNPDYREMADGALSSGKLLGFYHYSNGDDPIAEADSFFDAIRDYKGRAVPCLDWEGQGNHLFGSDEDVTWCKRFMDRISALMGSTCMLYTSKGHVNAYDWSMCASYPLWGAEYAYADHVYDGYEDEPWQSRHQWGAWGDRVTIHQYGYVLPRPNDGGVGALDGDIFYGTREDWQRMCGGGNVKIIYLNNEAAEMHYFMATDPRFGYEQHPERWGKDGDPPIAFTTTSGRRYIIDPGSFDCSSSTILVWRLALQGTPYEGALDGATCTSDMRETFVSSGLFTASLTPAKRGDLYLNEGVHVAMCQDGGSDGVFGFDCLTEFNMNENRGANWGEPGDQTGWESVFREYYDDDWNTVLHYNGRADYTVDDAPKPKQDAGEPTNSFGLGYQAHVQDVGWCEPVRDGQTAGTVGYGKRLEALRFTAIPAGWSISAKAHVQNHGWIDYGTVMTDTIIGSVGKSQAIEMLILDAKGPANDMRHLFYRVHQQNVGWKSVTPQGYASGTDGMSLRLEAVRIWLA